ncbi:MAG: hypothetical protein QW835_03445 [Candidatus Hadarchaeum sp.]|uniref:hypothetical protein n=1 Tax=Candidatus Hadarchaeum sp. TaxID=2883567 RepID=UPI00317FC8E4
MGKAGIAVAIVLVIVAASIGGAMATPIIVDSIGASPDSPLYGLRRLGEKIRMVSEEEQMKRRWDEYLQMVNKGKGLEYAQILEEFHEKMTKVASAEVEAKEEIVRWMQEQVPGIGLVELKLAGECISRSRGFVENAPGFPEGLENIIRILQELEQRYQAGTDEARENILAQLQLVMEQLRIMISRIRGQLPGELRRYFDADNLLMDARIGLKLRIGGGPVPWIENRWPVQENLSQLFLEGLEKFDNKLTKVQQKLEETSENHPGIRAAEVQIQAAIELRDNAIAENSTGNLEKAVFILKMAFMRLDCAERMLEQARVWRPEFPPTWWSWSKELPIPMEPWKQPVPKGRGW